LETGGGVGELQIVDRVISPKSRVNVRQRRENPGGFPETGKSGSLKIRQKPGRICVSR
jgi:hypothetical protein